MRDTNLLFGVIVGIVLFGFGAGNPKWNYLRLSFLSLAVVCGLVYLKG